MTCAPKWDHRESSPTPSPTLATWSSVPAYVVSSMYVAEFTMSEVKCYQAGEIHERQRAVKLATVANTKLNGP
jgi:hypothetical protein